MKNRVIIIAEAGVNHNGDIKTAKKLIDVAAEAGVDYVKFQTFKASEIVTKNAKKTDYQNKNTKNLDTQYEMLKKLELNEDSHHLLIKYCNDKGIKFLSTGFDLDSLEFLNKIGITLAKIPSGEITNFPYLKKVAQLFSEVILSTGMSDIQKELDVKVGYSDHTLGTEVPIAAVALGAILIEKHFTLDRSLPGPDHRASLEPNELKHMVKSIRNIEKALSGSQIKEPSKSELKNKSIIRKSIIAIKPIVIGETFTNNNIGTKRPGTGISPINWESVIGQISKYNFEQDELIRL